MGVSEVWTIQRLLNWTQEFFRSKGIINPRLDAEVLLAHLLGKDRVHLYVHFDEPLESDELAKFRELVKERALHKPIAYILGKREFMGFDFTVTPAVLIPRPDTEIIVESVAEFLAGRESPMIADIGTGSGAIGLSLLRLLPTAELDTVDISPAAIEVAEQNADSLGVSERVRFHEGDLLMPLAGKAYEAIISNPPYINDAEMLTLAPEVRDYEPHLALAGGSDGLDFYRRLSIDAPPLLKPEGLLAFEVGLGEAALVGELLQATGCFQEIIIKKDLAGMDRVVLGYAK